MTYHSISEGSTPRALAMARLVLGIILVLTLPVSIRLMVAGDTPAAKASSRCDKTLLSRHSWRDFVFMYYIIT